MPGRGLGMVCCLGGSCCLRGLLQHLFTPPPWLVDRYGEGGKLPVKKWGSSLGGDGKNECAEMSQ